MRWHWIVNPDSITVFSSMEFMKFLKPKNLYEEKLLRTIYLHSKKYMEEILKEEKEKLNSSIVSLEEINSMIDDLDREKIDQIIAD